MGVVILGATGSVGSALAEQLRASGTDVWLAGRNDTALQALAAKLDAPFSVISAEHPDSIGTAIAAAAERFGGLAGAANCIGSVLLKPAHQTSDAEFAQTIAVNLTTAFATVRAAAKAMLPTGGAIVLVSSAAAQIGIANHEAIAAAKGGIIALVKSAAATYAPQKIRVNAVAPGLVKSAMTRRLWEPPAAADVSIQMHALGRLGEPAEVAAAIAWLLSDQAGWISGQTLGVDGGLGSLLPRRKA